MFSPGRFGVSADIPYVRNGYRPMPLIWLASTHGSVQQVVFINSPHGLHKVPKATPCKQILVGCNGKEAGYFELGWWEELYGLTFLTVLCTTGSYDIIMT